MSIDLTGPQNIITAFFHRFTLRTLDRSPNVSSPCGISPRTGDTQVSNAMEQAIGTYEIGLPALSTLELRAGERIEIDEHPGKIYEIVFAPGREVINVERTYGAEQR